MKNGCYLPLAAGVLAGVLAAVLALLPAAATSQQFTRVVQGPPVTDGGCSFGVSWIDYDNDGYPDLHINNWIYGSNAAVNRLYHNEGDGTYIRVTTGDFAIDGGSVTSTWGDYDNDGDLDAYAPCPRRLNYFYVNNGDGTFGKASSPLGGLVEISQEASWIDFDDDGDLDLFLANHRFPGDPYAIACSLYRNDGGSFSLLDNTGIGLVEDEGGSVVWWDYDNDGDSDVLWSRNENTAVFFDSDGDGTFTQVVDNEIALPPAKYHFAPADFDNDGDLDLYADAAYPGPPMLYENMGNGDFELVAGQPISADVGYWTGGYWGDYDNDGYLDLIITAHNYYNPSPNRLYHNNGDGTFTKVLTEAVATDNEPSSSAAWADHDHDGDLDLFVANVNNYNNALYTNNGNGNAWIEIALTGTNSNRSAIGAKIRLKAVIGGAPMWQLREIRTRNGFFAQSDLTAHFGLGDATIVDSIKIEWPSGSNQTLVNLAPNQLLAIAEPDTTIATMLQSMSAALRGDCIEVTWTLSAVDEGIDFEVLRATCPGSGFAPAPGATLERTGLAFIFRDTRIARGAAYRYRVRYEDGGAKKVLFETDAIAVPAMQLDLRQNFPNPFNPSTRIEFDLTDRCFATLSIFDTRGTLVRTLVRMELEGGAHEAWWDGLDSRGRPAGSGLYFCHLTAGKQTVSRKLVLMR
jgi:hypothetical protein